jgi:hypothetical protein
MKTTFMRLPCGGRERHLFAVCYLLGFQKTSFGSVFLVYLRGSMAVCSAIAPFSSGGA